MFHLVLDVFVFDDEETWRRSTKNVYILLFYDVNNCATTLSFATL